MPTPEVLGLIAGNRSLPLILAREARAAGVGRLVAVGFENETDPGLASVVDELVWLKVGQLSKLIRAFRDRGVRQCVMAGQIAPRNLFDLRPDLRAMRLLWGLKERNAHTIFAAIANELKKEGVELIEATPWLGSLMPVAGFRLGPKLNRQQEEDLIFGYRMAKAIAALEIGQVVVVKEGTVLAVEAFEGTDRCLERGGALAGKGGGAVAVKVAKIDHDFRFDIPCIGPQTIEICAQSGVAVIGIDAGKTLLLERELLEPLTNKKGVTIAAVDPTTHPPAEPAAAA